MANQKANDYRRFKENERILSLALLADAGLFLFYLLFAGLGIIWLKVTLAIIAILLSLVCLASLYTTGEYRRQRSMYQVVGFCAVIVCILVSLLANYPSPYQNPKEIIQTTTGVLTMFNCI